jgi:hypothetical protein
VLTAVGFYVVGGLIWPATEITPPPGPAPRR